MQTCIRIFPCVDKVIFLCVDEDKDLSVSRKVIFLCVEKDKDLSEC